jgi:AraC-like DNA-binding protein
MADAEAALGHGDEAFRLLKESYEINDTLLARQAVANAQELDAVYQNQLKTEQISRLRLWVVVLVAVLAVLAVVTLVVRLSRLRERKNRAIVNVVRNLTNTDPTPIPADASRFATFDRTVEQGQLYTQSDLSREMLSDLMGVDRTTFSRIIREQSGCKNMNDYLNQKRIRHAARLLREQPNYTIQAVMEDSGFQSKSNFIRLFRDTYGMTPSEYQKGSA